MISTVQTIAELRAALAPHRAPGKNSIALVPTMGALHDGHVSLVREAARYARFTVVSIFVNPTQFAPHEDFAAYPRDLSGDLEKLADSGAGLVFAPTARDMYPEGFATSISVAGPARGLESDFRPHFFSGVATVVAKLLLAALPDTAVFGEKDYQQLLVVRRLVEDLALPTTIIGAPTQREPDGLALSSRNAYLNADQRRIAAQMNAIMRAAIARSGDLREAEAWGIAALEQAGFTKVDYLLFRDAATLAVLEKKDRPGRLLAAAHLGRTRLIDNMPV